jgi:hypothetical protein
MSEFHIHVDAQTLSEEFESYLTDGLGFWRSDFSGHPEGVEHFEPPHHLTKKVSSGAQFRADFDRLVAYAEEHRPMKGYLEGEFIALDEDLEERPFDASVAPPFRLETASLPDGRFRESEIHVVLDRDRSDPRLIESLMRMGLFTAYMTKPYGTAQVFTAQGSKARVQEILPALTRYLRRAGGAVNCSVKEERVAAWWLSGAGLRLPPIIDKVVWNEQVSSVRTPPLQAAR